MAALPDEENPILGFVEHNDDEGVVSSMVKEFGDASTSAMFAALKAENLLSFDSESGVPVPLQALMAIARVTNRAGASGSALGSLLVTVETTTGYAYEGYLVAIDSQYNVTVKDVIVYRKRILHVDLVENEERGKRVGSLASIFIKSTKIVLVELPRQIQGAFVSLARSVKRTLKEQKRKSKLSPVANQTGDAAKPDKRREAHGDRTQRKKSTFSRSAKKQMYKKR